MWIWKRIQVWFRTSTTAIFFLFISFVLLTGFIVSRIELHQGGNFQSWGDGIWWAIVTLSTTGYGDLIPNSFTGKILASALIIVGIIATSGFSGFVASVLIDRRESLRRGLLNLQWLQNHLVICGWRDDGMATIIEHILQKNTELSPKQVIIITANSHEDMQPYLNQTKPHSVQFIHGECYSEQSLLRANVKKAQKVLVLSDSKGNQSHAELDAQIIMTVLAIRNLSKKTYIVAELHDARYRDHLRNANCNEILLLNDFHRSIIAEASTTLGLSGIIQNLVASSGEVSIITSTIPTDFINKTYGEYHAHTLLKNSGLLIGILENVGNSLTIKLTAFREAQKTSNTTELIDNLVRAKTIQMNRPVLLPPPDHSLDPNSHAIFLIRNNP